MGHGIKATALNIAEKLAAAGEYEVRAEDVQAIIGGSSTRRLGKFYLLMLEQFAFVWGFLYNSKVVLWLSLPLRKFAAKFKSKNVLLLLRQYQPAVVVCTQTVATGIISYLKAAGLYRGKLVAVFSDFHLHRFWMYGEVDLYICAIAEQAQELQALGVPQDRIAVTGMLLADKFQQAIDKEEAKRQLGLLTSMPVILLFNGARPRMHVVETFKTLIRSSRSFQVIAVCALNRELREELEKISSPGRHPVKILGYADNMDVIMAASDVLIGKTGGPTMGEAILKRLPIIITDALPGHEEKNLKFLVDNRIVRYGRIDREVLFLTEQILEGKLRTDWLNAESILIKPAGQISIAQALEKVKPQQPVSTLKVLNYQD